MLKQTKIKEKEAENFLRSISSFELPKHLNNWLKEQPIEEAEPRKSISITFRSTQKEKDKLVIKQKADVCQIYFPVVEENLKSTTILPLLQLTEKRKKDIISSCKSDRALLSKKLHNYESEILMKRKSMCEQTNGHLISNLRKNYSSKQIKNRNLQRHEMAEQELDIPKLSLILQRELKKSKKVKAK